LDRFSYFFKLLIDFLLLYPPAKDLTLNKFKTRIEIILELDSFGKDEILVQMYKYFHSHSHRWYF
jgi:hypothetical protein